MLAKLRSRLTFANVVSVLALFVALGGSSYAALTVTGKSVKDSSLTGKDVKNRSLTGADMKKSSLTSTEVKDRSLLSKDFKSGQLPAGPKGDKGDKGDKGETGAAGSARAYAFVDNADALVPARSKGFTSVTHTNGTGNYCLTLDPSTGIDSTKIAPQVTIEYNTAPGNRLFGFWAKDACAAGQVGVLTANEDTGPGTTFAFTDEPFTVVVP